MAAHVPAPIGGLVDGQLPQLVNRENGEFSPEVLEMLQEAIRSANESFGRDICAFIGVTGSGKSTLVNSLFGRRMVRTGAPGRYRIEVAPEEREIARIARSRLVLETTYARAYREDDFPYTLVDCAGFVDPRGVLLEAINAVSMKLILENARSVRLAVCYESDGLTIRKGGDLCDLLDRVYRRLLGGGGEQQPDSYLQDPNSIALILTKVNRTEEGWHHSDDPNQDALTYLTECRDEALEGGRQRRLFDFIIREGGRYLRAFKPLEQASVAGLSALFGQMEGIQEPRGKFRLTYSPEATIAIARGFTQIAQIGLDLLEQHEVQLRERAIQNLELEAMVKQIARLQDAVQRLTPEMNPTVEEIDQTRANLIRENQEIIERGHQAIKQWRGQIAEDEAHLQTVRARIEQCKIEGDEEVEYWSQNLNQPGIRGQRGERRTITTVKAGFLGIFGRSTSQQTIVTPDIPAQSIGHDFEYRGPRYIRIERDSTRGGAWGEPEESPDRTHYKIHFESGVGNDAIASIRAIIRRGDDPSEQIILTGFRVEETRIERQKHRFEELIRARESIIHRAEIAIQALQNILNRPEDSRTDIERLEKMRVQLNQRIARTDQERREIEQTMVEKDSQFRLLFDYLRLSQDEHLGNEPLIAKILKKYHEYQQPLVAP